MKDTYPPQTQPQAFIATTYNLETCCVCNNESNKHEGCHLVCDTHFKADRWKLLEVKIKVGEVLNTIERLL